VREEASFEGVEDHEKSIVIPIHLAFHVDDVLKLICEIVDHLEPTLHRLKLPFESLHNCMKQVLVLIGQ
jgi:hypothetical protein